MFTANSMNCLIEALGLGCPATAPCWRPTPTASAVPSGRPRRSWRSRSATTSRTTQSVLPRSIATVRGVRERDDPGHRDGRLDQHRAAPARRGARGRASTSPWTTSTASRAGCRASARWRRRARSTTWRTSTGPAASWRSWASWTAAACSIATCPPCTRRRSADAIAQWDVVPTHATRTSTTFYRAAPGGVPTQVAFSQDRRYPTLDVDRGEGCIRDVAHAYSTDGGLAVLYGNIAARRLHRQDRGRRRRATSCSAAARASSRARTRRSTASWRSRS